MPLIKRYLDSETCGLHSMAVLLQYAEGEGPIHLHEVWRQPVRTTLNLIEWLCEECVVGFNLSFDWFHIVKLYTIFRLCDPDWIPQDHVNEIALLEPRGQDGPCVKPASALDLLLHSRKGPYQALMAREDIRIKRVPTALAYALAGELERRIQLDSIYFAKSADPNAPKWQTFDRKDRFGDLDTEFKDVVLRFNPAGGLKFLAEHAMGFKPKFHFKDVEPQTSWRPYELGYAPTALAVSSPEKNWEVWGKKKGKLQVLNEEPVTLADLDAQLGDAHDDDERPKKPKAGVDKLLGYAWPGVIGKHIAHWATRPDAREYANDDIVYTRALDHHFGDPPPGDDDSILACMVPVVRWHGFQIDIPGMKGLLAKAQAVVDNAPVNINKPGEVRGYVTAAMDETEGIILEASTKKANLEAIREWEVAEDEPCAKCVEGTDPQCPRCGGTGVMRVGRHPAALRAGKILDVKIAAKEVELYQKLLLAGKFHASFVVIGTLSSRMAGADGLNPQGIKHTKDVRRMFPLSWDGYILCGGDFDSFEVTLADAVYNDPSLRAALCSGKKIHALFGMEMYPGKTYEDILASADTEFDMYTKGKQGVFGMIYGGDWNTLVGKFGLSPEVAQRAEEGFFRKFPGIPKARQKTFDAFCSMKQPGGLGSAVVWADPAEYIESFLGFRRYFSLENKICKALFDLARKPPKNWAGVKVKVVRRDRVQTAGGAVSSALYGASFAMQAANMRAAANHEIQSPGAQITKAVQRKLWELQPAGVHDLRLMIMNVHDELLCVTRPELGDTIVDVVRENVERFRPKVPLIGITWHKEMQNWAEKKGTADTVKIRAKEMR
jgi:hypothetical protein